MPVPFLRNILSAFVFLLNCPTFACVFQNHDMSVFDDARVFQTTESVQATYPKDLFSAFPEEMGIFDKYECRNAIEQKSMIHKKTKVLYTAFFTTKDECDGGNFYGVIVEGLSSDPLNAVAIIEDSDLSCL